MEPSSEASFPPMKEEMDKGTERCRGHLTKFGGLQSLLGVVCTVLSLAALGVDRGDFSRLELENQDDMKYVIIGLDISSLVSSLWFVHTGMIPWTCCSCCWNVTKVFTYISWIKLKVKYMVFSIVGASVFVPILVGSQATILVLRGHGPDKLDVLPAMLIAVAVIEFLVAISASVFVCYSPWWGPYGMDIHGNITGKCSSEEKNPVQTVSVKFTDEKNPNLAVEIPPPYTQ